MNAPLPVGQAQGGIDASRARQLTDRIKVALEGTWLLIQEAYLSRAWTSLGYESWDDYCTREFGTSRLKLPREERPEVVASMREIGMSVRAIASATNTAIGTVHQALPAPAGVQERTPRPTVEEAAELLDVSVDQVHRAAHIRRQAPELGERIMRGELDLDQAEQLIEPKPITGTDGKTYRASGRSSTEDNSMNKPASRRRPLTDTAQAAGWDLRKAVDRIERILADDRYSQNKEQIGQYLRGHLLHTIQCCQEGLARLGPNTSESHENGQAS